MKRFYTLLILCLSVFSTLMAGTPVDMYLTGDFNGWKFESKYQFSKVADNSYEIDLGKSPLLLKPGIYFKILSSDYDTYDYGTTSVYDCGTSYTLVKDKGANCKVESLILFSKVTFSTLTNEMILHCANGGEYSKTATLYIGVPCGNDSAPIGFGAFATKADFNNGAPYAIVKAQKVPSMYIHGYQVYKAEIPFDERVYVASMGYSSFSSVCKEFTEEGAWYCASSFPSIDVDGWYRSFDEARFNVDLIDLNFKPEANTLYVIGRTPWLTVYSSEYGIEQGKEINFEGVLGYTLKGKGIHYYPVTNVDIFDMVRYDGKDMAIDWNKPFFYEGECYASLKDVPVDEIKESSCWRLWGLNTTSMALYHVGNNVYKETYTNWTIVPTDEALNITFGNHSSNVSGCVRQTKAIATPEQTGKYNITFTYDANTQDLTHEWELVSADDIYVNSSDIVGYFYGSSYYGKKLDAKMELVGVNEYKYTCKAEMEKGLKYYTIKDSYSNFTAKDILFQIPETWLYEFTFTYNAVTQKYACDVKKSYDFDPIYFRGTVNEWGVDEKYKLTTTDGDYYVATYAAGKEVELGDPEGGIAKFKIGSGNDIWYPIDFGYSNSQNKYLTAGTPCILASDGSDVTIVGSLKASKIEFTKSTGTLLVTAAQAESEYTTVYVVNENRLHNIYAFARPITSPDYDNVEVEKLPKTYQGYEVYSYTFKSIYDQLMINGTGGNSISNLTVNKVKPYYYGGVWYETLTFDTESEGGEGDGEGGDQGGDDTGDVEIGEPANLYIIGALTGWAADPTWQFSTADDEYFVLSFPKGQEQELSGLFKVASSNWSPYNYGAPLDLGSVEAGKEYVLEYNVATNLSIANIIKVSKIEFTLSTQTLKITGATEEKVFDTTSDYGFHLYADYKDYRFTFKGNGVYEYDYTGEGPSSTIGDYQYKTVEWGRNSTGNTVTLGELYQLGLSNHPISFPDATNGQTLTIVLTVLSDWSATILVKEKSSEEGGGDTPVVPDPTPEPEGLAFFVAGNGGSDATGIWCNGIEWSSVGVETANNMTDADKDGIYEITFNQVPAGTWNFKVVGVTEGNMSWMGSDFLDTTNSSTGYTTAPYDGNIGFTLTQAANVTVKYNTATGKIILTTPSGSFGKVKIDYFAVANTDECYVENIFEANNNTLKYTVDIQVSEESGFGYAVFRILGNCNYAVYENSLLVEVTESGKYEVTIVFNGDYENPEFTITYVKQGSPDTPVGPTPDPIPDPVVAIKNLMIQPFEQVLPKTTTSTVATFTLQNANTATVSIEGLDADFFEIGEQNIGNGECSVSIVFKPIVIGVYYATLVVTTDDEVSLSIDFAAAAGDETFDPGDVPELNPDPVNPGTPDDEVSVEEVSAVMIYAKEGTVYSEVDFEIYDLAGVNVTKLNGSLQGVYIVKTADGNRLVSVW